MSLIKELKRRNVFRVGVAYVIIAWLLLQVSDTLVPALYLPQWFQSGVAFLLILGFPVALIFAWAFELTSYCQIWCMPMKSSGDLAGLFDLFSVNKFHAFNNLCQVFEAA